MREREVPPNPIAPDASEITPALLPLITLPQEDIDTIIAHVPGGVANVQDIYALSSLQEGMLFRHHLASEDDTYVLITRTRFRDRAILDRYLAAMQHVVDRHDVLRTAIVWEGLSTPAQVVWRRASLPVREVTLAEADALGRERLDLTRAPLLELAIARDPDGVRWHLAQLSHHIVSDHESLDLMAAEIDAILAGREGSLPDSPPYRNLVASARSGGDGEATHERYFRAQLADIHEPSAPFGIVNAHGDGRDVTEAHHVLPSELDRRLRAQAQRLGVGLATLCHVAWSVVVSRTSGHAHAVFGTVLLGRMHVEGADRALGLYLNTLPIKLDVGASTVEVAVREAQAALAELLRHEHAPLALAQRCSGVVAPTPLFTTLLNYRHMAPRAPGGAALGIETYGGEERTNYPLVVSVNDEHTATSLSIQAVRPLSPERVGAMMERALDQLADALAQTPQRPLEALDIVDPAEHAQLAAWNATASDLEREPFVVDLIEAQVDRAAEATALTFEGVSMTYRELDARVNQLAHHLLAAGAGRGRTIGVCLARSPAMVMSVLAILKTGAAYVPIDPTYPDARMRAIREASGCVLVVDDTWLAAHIGGSTARPGIQLGGYDAAYVLFTSGSTGTPKGVVIEHAGVRNRLRWPHAFGFTSADRFVLKTPFTFDVSVFELLYPFVVGGCVVIAAPDGHRDPQYLAELIRDERVTYAHFVPSMLGPFLEAARATPCPTLRRVICSGEALPAELVRDADEVLDAELYNLYGPTEATVDVTWWHCDPASRIVPIGVAAPNTRLYILDRRARPVPIGVAGELYLAGVQLARGYAGRPDLTAERFVPDPFHAGERMYRTGDLARFLPDGAVEYLGRLDNQVKLRGLRIELGEIEAVLRTHAEVSDAAVIVRADSLIAYVVPRAAGAVIASDVLQAILRAALPEYMVPAVIVSLPALPLTASGKLDRKALPTPELGVYLAPYVAPRDATEAALVEIWQDLLGSARVGVHDDFFALGGHSLLATRLLAQLRKRFALELSVRAVFDAKTIEGLAVRIASLRGNGAAFAIPPLVPAPPEQRSELSFTQRRLWFLHELEPESPAYQIAYAHRLDGIDVETLRRAFEALVHRHESLRTTFHAPDGEPHQQVHPPMRWTLDVDDVRALEAGAQEVVLARIARAQRRPFDLATGPLLRTQVVRVADEVLVLFVTLHHIITDGWSDDILWRELWACYDALAADRHTDLSPLTIQYADYAAWQRSWLEGAELDRQLAFWTEHLRGAPEEAALPFKGPRPPRQTFGGRAISLSLEPALAHRLRTLARREGASLFMTLAASLRGLLARYTGQTDVLLGTAITNRSGPELENLIGMFVNTIVLRNELREDDTFASLLAREKAQALAAYDHQHTPFERVVDALGVERSLSRPPVFQVMYVHQGEISKEHRGQPVALDPVAMFDLNFETFEQGERISLSLIYNEDLFEHALVEQLVRHYLRLLDQVTREPHRSLATLDILDDDDHRRLEAWNATARPIPEPRTVHFLVEEQILRTPEAIAVACGDVRLTYRELGARIERVAGWLAARGVTRGDHVAVAVDRTADMVVAVLGVLRVGAAYVPIDPEYPAHRQAFVRSDADAVLEITDATLREALASTVIASSIRVDEDDVAYVLYTSGSTGNPKGVRVPHRAVVNFLRSMQRAPGLEATDTLLAVTTLSFDIAGLELYLPLITGATLVIASREATRDGRLLAKLLASSGVTVMQATPATWRMLLAADWRPSSRLKILCGGEALPPELTAQLLEGAGAVWNLYGPTETTIWSTCAQLAPGLPITLGRPIDNTTLYVLDDARQLAPIGVAGELYIGGGGVALGYLDRPELTAERFLADPFAAAPSARMYRTGDRVRWLPDGTLAYLGRIDNQVKLRGFRIELGEIEATLRASSGVRDAAVILREDTLGNPYLAAYVVPEDLDVTSLEATLTAALPDYMVPSAFVALSALPLTPNGKFDRKALPAPQLTSIADYVAPRTLLEEAIAQAWRELLRVERIGIHDDFFALGGHSLLATRLLVQLRKRFAIELPVRAIFEAPTLASLATLVARLRADGAADTTPPLVPALRDAHLPLSFAQQRLWFLQQLSPDSTAYSVLWPRRLRGPLDVEALRGAFEDLVARHEALRTVFPSPDGEPYQEIRPPQRWPLSVEDTPGLDEAAISRLLQVEARHRFELDTGPLLRTRLLRLGADDHLLIVTLHHILWDGWSMSVFSREMSELYARRVRGERYPLPELPIQYADYASWQRSWLVGDVLERQLTYWTEHLRGAPEQLELPSKGPRPPLLTDRAGRIEVDLDSELTARLHEVAQRAGTTMFITLLAGLRVVLSRYSGQDDIAIGTPVANRSHSEIESLIGFFANTLVMRNDVRANETFRELLTRETRIALAAYENQDAPFEMVVDRLGIERDLSRTALFQVMHVHESASAADDTEALGELTSEELGDHTKSTKFDLTVSSRERQAQISVAFDYNLDLFEHALVEQLARHFVRLLDQVTRAPHRALIDIELLDGAERDVLISATPAVHLEGANACVHELFEAHARRSPETIAVVCETEQRTYRELDQEATALAHRLVALGVGPDVVVGLHLDRTIEFVVGMLAVLKAGGAYLPLDPKLPHDRLSYMATDARARVVLSADDVITGPWTTLRVEKPRGDVATPAPLVGRARPRDLVYVLYTSGSTGQPKGVLVEHRGLVNYTLGVIHTLGLVPGTSFATVTTLSGDVGNTAIFPALCGGGTLHLISWDRATSARQLGEYFARHRVDVLKAVPSLAAALLDSDEPAAVLPRQMLILGGEPLPWDLVDRVAALAPACAVLNSYGPTETTVAALMSTSEGRRYGVNVPVGRTLPNQRAYILDAWRRPSPAGVVGEMYIAGDGVTRGYVGRSDLTEERFLPDPFVPGDRMYRTVDRVRRLPDGSIEFHGRVDTQVKLRGFRIELGEIEATIRAAARVADAAVILREDTPGHRYLAAYVVAPDDLDVASLEAALAAVLPDYMIPSAFVTLPALPLTVNGKLDRKALPAPHLTSGTAYVAPRTPVEEAIAQSWRELLGVEQVGINDDFFALGGHSLLATRLVARLRAQFAIELPVRAIFEAKTIGSLAARVGNRGNDAGSVLPALVPGPRGARPPLSFAQQRLWFLDQLDPDGPAYQVAYARQLERLDVESLRRALEALVHRHEILRTSFPAHDGEPYQRVHPTSTWILDVEDLRALDAGPRDTELARIRAAQRTPFDLATGPLFRTHLVRIADTTHVLFVTFHHIVTDGASNAIFWRELWAYYDALVEGRALELSPLPVQYADYAAWQRDWLQGAELERQLGFWTERLRGAPDETALPFKGSRPPRPTFAGRTIELTLDHDLTRRLRTLARREGTSLFMTLAASLRTLLARYTGQTDLLLGTAISNRNAPELEGLVGMFVNTLVLRNELRADDTFATLLAREKAQDLSAYEHQHTPFELVVDALGVERSLSRPPVFQVMYVHQGELAAGLRGQNVETASSVALFDLDIETWEQGERLGLALTYNTDLFEHAVVEQLVRHYLRLLDHVTRDPQRSIATLDLLDSEEHQRLHAWNATQRPYDDALVHALFEAQVDRTPDAIAVVCEGAQLSFHELDRRANQLAHALRARGAGPDQPVVVLLERSLDFVIAVLAIAKAGGAYLPINPSTPRARLHRIVADANVRLVVGHRHLAALVDELPVQALWLDTDHAILSEQPATRPLTDVSPDHLIYILYTSGSTGTPKGVMISHRGLANNMRWLVGEFALGPADVMLQQAAFQFDASALELWSALLSGARLVMIGPSNHGDPHHVVQTIRTHGVTSGLFIPSFLAALLDDSSLADTTLTRVFSGGEALTGALVRRFDAPAKCELINLYGPTEITIDATMWRVPRDFAGDHVPIGRAVANTTLHVLDAGLRPVPLGVAGELYIGGVQLARGYLNSPDLTAERFLDDPFTTQPGARLYRTGDLVRWTSDGTLAYLGRIDAQVKLRGFRIELGEIEATLRASSGVSDAVVILREDTPGSPYLAAYVVPEDLDVTSLEANLTAALPDYMVPRAFVALAALPLTPNGKLDRKALPAPDLTSITDYVAPRTPSEEAIAQVWRELLRVERIGIHDDFFALGGHSLLAARLIARLRALFSIELPVRAIFEAPTLASLATLIARLRVGSAADITPPLVPALRGEHLPLSFGQQRLWFLHHLEPDSSTYNLGGTRWLRGPVDPEALRGALEDLVHRHETLRTHFPMTGNGEPRVAISPPAAWELPVEDQRRLDPTALARLVSEERTRPFDLGTGPLLRTRLLRTGEDEHLFVLRMHHIISDGWSMGVLWSELGELYAARTEGRAAALPPLPIQYVDYAAWQRARLEGGELARQLQFWTSQLQHAPTETALPLKGPRPAQTSSHDQRVNLRLSLELSRKLQALALREGATLFMTLLAALRALLARYTGQTDLVIGTPSANRDRHEIEGLIGFFISTLAIRGEVRADDSFVALLAREKAATLAAYDHQETPFELIVDALQLERRLDVSPLFQVWFVHLNIPRATRILGEHAAELEAGDVSSKFDLAFYSSTDDGGEIELELQYKPELFDVATIERMAAHYQALLAQIVEQPEVRVDALLAERFQHQVEHATEPTTIWDRFVAAAETRATHIAVREAARAWTYAELRDRADAIAARLDDAGIGDRVACLLSHGGEMVAGILGILAGARAYVPLDGSHPVARSSLVLADSGAQAILCDATYVGLATQLAGNMPVIRVDEALTGGRPKRRPRPETLAYCLYTSGSTGRPKGVLQQHAHVVHFIDAYRRHLAIEPTDVLTLLSTFAFDAAVVDVFSALLSGATLAPYDLRSEGLAELASTLVHRGVTIYHSTPTVFRALVQLEPRISERVRAVALGGEEVRADDVHRFRAAFSPTAILVNGYGMTECSWALLHTVHPGDPIARPTLPLGTPIEGVRVTLQTPLGPQLAAYGVGTITIESPHVALGYWQRPDETATSFPAPNTYVTSDHGRLLPDGHIEFAGRHAAMVKLRGLRIDLGEIEVVLADHPEIGKAAVVLHEGPRGEEIVAYVVAAAGYSEPSPAAIRDYLATKLPDYMVPTIVMPMPALPLGATGKLDRKALPVPDLGDVATDYVAPRDEVEEAIAQIWQNVLGVERVGSDDDFFDLGGHSLSIIRVLAAVRKTLGVDVSIRVMFEHSTLASFAREVSAARDASPSVPRSAHEAVPSAPSLRPPSRSQRPPLSFAQQRLWFLHQLDPDSIAYHVGLGYSRRLEGLDVEAFRQALEALVHRHEILRTTFATEDGVPFQRVHPPERWVVDVEDVAALSPAAQQVALARIVAAQRRPFDLSTGPLLRTQLVRVADDAHVLFVTMHHIVTDGGSYAVFWRELWAAYDAIVAGSQAQFDPLPIQYADFAAWQRSWLQGAELDRQLAFWTERLRGAPDETALPFKAPRPPRQTFGGRMLAVTLTPEISRRLRGFARREGVSLFMTFAASLRAMLARYTGQHDVLLGTAITSRSAPELDALIGMFVNTLVLRNELRADDTFVSLVAREKVHALAAYDHQHTPFELVVDALGIERSLSRPPVFQVMYIHQGETVAELRGEAVPFTQSPAALVDLSVHSWEAGDDVGFSMIYNQDLFDQALVEQLIRHYVRLLDLATREPHRVLATLDLHDDEDHRRLRTWNATARTIAEPETIHALVAQQVTRTPDAIAVTCNGVQLTYRALAARIDRVAGWLVARGVARGDRVAVTVDRSADMVVAVLAVMSVGAAYVPIDPEYPTHRQEFVRTDAGAVLELTDATLRDALTSSLSAPDIRVDGADVAYILYTSGSTGNPKGVRVPHHAVVNFLRSMQREPGIAPSDTLVAVTTLSFDIAGLELYLPLITGATLVIASRDATRDGHLLAALLDVSGATIMQATPATWRMLLAADWRPTSRLRILCGGEAMPPELAAQLLDGAAAVWNLYGPTETTIWSTCAQLAHNQPITLGRPIDNTALYILDEARQLAPIGVPGELYIGGRGVALGYHARPELTAERFIDDPFSTEPGARMYRTGDRVRWTSDGNLHYLGRADNQIKLRGFRIELGEIENALRASKLVADAAVLLREDVPGNPHLVAYVVAPDDLDVTRLKTALATALPDYMVPSAFVVLDAFPLTPNGKLDRKALPAPDVRATTAYVAPRDDLEETMAQIWRDLLHVERIGVHDDFFALGGHSLLAIRLLAKVESSLGVRISLRELFVYSTLSGLAVRVGQARASDGASERPTLYASATRRARLPAALRGVFKLNKLTTSDLFARHAWSAWIDGRLDVISLERAVAAMRVRHALLRTRFFENDGREMLEVLDPADVEGFALLERVDLSSLSEVDRVREDTEFYRSACFRPLDVEHGEVMSVALSRWSETRHRLTVSLHNIVSDGESVTVYVNELCELWRAFAADPEGDPVGILPPAPLQYHHLADYLERVHDSEVGRAHRVFWKGRLEGIQPLELPTDSPREEVDARREANAGVVAFRSGSVVREIPQEILTAIERTAESRRATVMATLVAAMAGYLSQRTSQRDLAFITRLSHRYMPGLERALGFLVNPILLRISTAGATAFSELVDRTHGVVTDAFDHGECDLFELAPYSAFRFCLVYTRVAPGDEDSLRLPNGTIATRAAAPGTSAESQIGYDLVLWLQHSDDRVRLYLAYNLELFRDTTAVTFLEGFVTYVAAACMETAGPSDAAPPSDGMPEDAGPKRRP